MNKRLIIGIVVVAIVSAAIYGWSEYSRKPAGASDLQASVVVSVDPLIEAFTADEVVATRTFADAVIQVSGTVQEVEPQGEKVNVHLVGADPLYRVTCEFDASNAPDLAAGSEVAIRGICAGFTGFDVLLQRCALITE